MHLAINGFFWNQPHTGSGQYTRQLVTYLSKLVSDLRITLVYPESSNQNGPENPPENVEIKLVKVRPGQLGKVHFEQILFPRACKAAAADIVHVPYWGGPLQSPAPLVVTIHDLTTVLYREYRRGVKTRLYNALVSAGARSASHIITDSKASRGDIVEYLGIREERITSIYLAAGEEFKPEPDLLLDMAIARKYELPEEYILYLGGYGPHKNVKALLKAYSYVRKALGTDYPLVLAGAKPEKQSKSSLYYEGLIAKLELEEVIHWAGFVDEQDKPTLYRGAASFAFPSLHEGFGLPPLEAMACGTPVVASNRSSLPEVIGSAGFTLDPDDYRGMGGSIIATVVQEELAEEMRRKGLEQAAKFSWERTVAETVVVYQKVVDNG